MLLVGYDIYEYVYCHVSGFGLPSACVSILGKLEMGVAIGMDNRMDSPETKTCGPRDSEQSTRVV